MARIADVHFNTPPLYHRLIQKGLLPLLPEDLQALPSEIHTLNHLHNETISDETNRIAALLNPAGIEPVFLKDAIFTTIEA